MERGIRFIGNGQAPVHKYWAEILQMIRDGTTDPLAMLTHRVSIDDLETVYAKFDARQDGIQKVFVETRFSAPRAEGTPGLTRFGGD